MAKKITKKSRRRLFLIVTMTIAILMVFSFNVSRLFSQVMGKNKEAEVLISKKEDLKDEENYLKVQVDKLNDPDYIARYAREKYLYSKDGEFTIRIEKDEGKAQ
jgi:cell division protein DivIC